MYLRYSSKVVAPMHWISPRERAGFSTFDAPIALGATADGVWSSSMKRMTFLALRTSFMTALMRSSNWPRYFVPATIMARSSTTTCDHAAGQDLLGDDLLGQPFDDGRLADAGFTQQHRIVLRTTAEDLHQTFDLLAAADDRIELTVLGQLGQIPPEAVEGRCLALAASWSRRLRFALFVLHVLDFIWFDPSSEEVEHFLADFPSFTRS